jgi:hypothetical protein
MRIPIILAGLIGLVVSKECTVANNGGTDDTEHILAAFTDCQTDSTITFEARNYSSYTPVTLANLSTVIHLSCDTSSHIAL